MIEIIFAEFGNNAVIDTGQYETYFPGSKVSIYRDGDVQDIFEKHDRWGWRMHDYWKVEKSLESDSEIVLAMDADMKIVSDKVKAIVPLTKAFGVCLPANPRLLVSVDTLIGADSDGKLDTTFGTGYAMNSAIISFDPANPDAREYLNCYCSLMLNTPMRAPLALWRADYETRFFPCLLPPQWCVCAKDCGIGNEIILHIGHKEVRDYYHA